MLKKTIAIILCLALTLLACACAASDVTVSAPESTDNKGGNTPDLSTMEQPGTSLPIMQMSSQPEPSDEVSKPTEPILPEEKETTLEKVLSFEIGENGLFSYHFMYPQEPAPEGITPPDPTILVPEECCVDEQGNLYILTYINGVAHVFSANNGASIKVNEFRSADEIYAYGGHLYVQATNTKQHGFCEYTEGGFVKQYIYKGFDNSGTVLRFDAEGTPYFITNENGLLSLDGTPFLLKNAPEISRNDSTMMTYGSFSYPAEEYAWLYGATLQMQDGCVYTQYDFSKNTLYRFVCNIEPDFDRSIACEITDGESVIKSYRPCIATVGNTTLEAMDFRTVDAWNGTMYLLAFYPDHADLYRINPGYTDEDFYDTITEEGEATPSSVVEASVDSPGMRHGYGEDHSHAHTTAEEAEIRAFEMCEVYSWELLYGHAPNSPPAGVTLPAYVDEATLGENMPGIPYCWGGFYGLEDESVISFATAVKATDSNGEASYIAGNICKSGGYKGGTIGLDCSGFVSSVYDFYAKCNTSNLAVGGHAVSISEVDSAEDLAEKLRPMDLIVSPGSHCMLFKCYNAVKNEIEVYECTARSGVEAENTAVRSVTWSYLNNNGYIYRKMTCVYASNATTHWYVCPDPSCSYASNAEPHTFSVTYTASTHTSTCEECNHTITESHTMSTGYLYNTTHHWRGCTANCGKKTHNALHNTSNFGACSVCGYNPNVLNTRPGTEVILEQ